MRLGAFGLCAGGLALAGCASQSPAPAPIAEAPWIAPSPATVTPTQRAILSVDMPVEKICSNPAGKAVIDRDLPGLTTRPEYPMFKMISLKSLVGMSGGRLSNKDLAKVQADLSDAAPGEVGPKR